jgi:hypothetical protein
MLVLQIIANVMAVQCGTVTVLYCLTLYILLFDVTYSIVVFNRIIILLLQVIFDVMAVQCGMVTFLYCLTLYILVFVVTFSNVVFNRIIIFLLLIIGNVMAVQCCTVTVLYCVTLYIFFLMSQVVTYSSLVFMEGKVRQFRLCLLLTHCGCHNS